MNGPAPHLLTLTAGFFVRPCCVIPAALAVAGTGGAGIASAMAPYRPWFLAVAGLLFAASFHVNFVRNRSRPGMAIWGVSLLVAASLLLGPFLRGTPRGVARADPNPQKEKIVMAEHTTQTGIGVEGMACDACARRLEKALRRTSGVAQARVTFEEKRAEVSYDANQIDRAALEKCIRDTGFKPSESETAGDPR